MRPRASWLDFTGDAMRTLPTSANHLSLSAVSHRRCVRCVLSLLYESSTVTLLGTSLYRHSLLSLAIRRPLFPASHSFSKSLFASTHGPSAVHTSLPTFDNDIVTAPSSCQLFHTHLAAGRLCIPRYHHLITEGPARSQLSSGAPHIHPENAFEPATSSSNITTIPTN